MLNRFKCSSTYVIAEETTPPPSPNPDDAKPTASGEQPTIASSEQPTAAPSEQQSAAPSEQQSAAPSETSTANETPATPNDSTSAAQVDKPKKKKELALGRLSPDWPYETIKEQPQLTYEDPYADFGYIAAEGEVGVPTELQLPTEDYDEDQEADAYYDDDDDDGDEDEINQYTHSIDDEDDLDDELWNEEDLDPGNYYEPIDYDSLFVNALSADEFVEQQSAVDRRPVDELLNEVRSTFQPSRLHLQPTPRDLPAIPDLAPVAWRGPPFLPAIRYFGCGELVRHMLPKPEELEEAAARNAADRQSRLPDIDADPEEPALNDNTRPTGSTNGNNNAGTALLNEVASDVRPSPKPHKNLQGKGLKRPPQPHMCIRERNSDGEELFINVMSWTRIMMPASPDDPIPLYGGMRVPRCNQRSPPNIYAVMVNPDILKHVGRTCPDPHEKIALVQLMSDFVEAMNPGLELSRSAEILVDRDLAGELKDIWCAVQAKRERDKETINLGGVPTYSQAIANAAQQRVLPPNQQPTVSSVPIATPAGPAPASASAAAAGNPSSCGTAFGRPASSVPAASQSATKLTAVSSATAANSLNNNANPVAVVSAVRSADSNKSQVAASAPVTEANTNVSAAAATTVDEPDAKASTAASAATASTAATASATASTASATKTVTAIAPSQKSQKSPPVIASTPTPPTTPPTSTKKERLGGFLPNGCQYMFPFIKSKKDKKDKKNAAAANSEAATNPGGDEAPEKSDSGKDGDDLDRANM